MLDPVPASPSPSRRRLRALACLSVLGLSASSAGALPPLEPGPAPGFLLVQGGPPGSQKAQEDPQAPFKALNQVLEDTRAILEELTEAVATVAPDVVRKELQALKRDKERLAAQLQQANARSTELARSDERAEARVTELTKAVEEASRKAARADEALAGQVRRNQQLDESLARAEIARDAALTEAEKTRAEMAKALEAATNEAAQSEADLAGLHEELEAHRKELATAARARDEWSAANTEITRLKTTNAELEKEIASWRTSSRSAIETARQNLVMMEEEIEELTAALALEQPAEAAPAPAPQAKSAPVEDERATPARSPAAIAQPSAREPPSKTGAGRPADSPMELPETELSMVGPSVAPAKVDPRLERFRADIESVNDLVRSGAAGDLFSGIESVSGRTVDVAATAAWDALPEVGKKSYLESLLDRWVAAQGGQGPAVVRIVDPSGRVLVEKSWP